jgi:Tol biopolymer transport system component
MSKYQSKKLLYIICNLLICNLVIYNIGFAQQTNNLEVKLIRFLLGGFMNIYKRRKVFTKLVFRVLLFVIVAIVTIGGQCVGKMKPNPERKLVLSKNGYYLFNPVFHLNNEWIYYLAIPDTGQTYQTYEPQFSGSIWRVNTDGTNDRIVLDGHYALLTISHNGEKLAFIKGSYPWPNDENDDKIIIADTSGIIIDTIQITGGETVSWIKFGRNDDKIYYSTTIAPDTTGYFSINLEGVGEELLFSRFDPYGLYYYFDLFANNSLYIHCRVAPALHPQNPNYVVFSDDYRRADLVLQNLGTEEVDSLIAAPYGTPVYIDLPSWSPDGDRVIYYVGPQRGSSLTIKKLELWMIEGIELR